MRSVISLILVYCLAITSVFAQSVNPNDTLKIGKASSSSDKGLTFDTNDGVSNKKLLIEKISKKLKFDGNTFQIGDGSSSSDKELIIAGALKSLKYNGTSGEFEFNDDVKLSGTLKADFLQAVNTEVAINSLLRASQGIKVGAGANEIRVNAGNLEFSNDGVLYKKFGTGSGGGSTGVNLLENDSFEDGVSTGWTSSGGTFSQQTYTNGVEGDLKYARFVASTSGQYVETTAVAIPTSFSGGCQADFKKVNVATAGLFKIQAMDTTGATVYAEQTIGVSSWIKVPTISFPCPVAGTMVKLRLISLTAGTIDFDRGYIGSNQNIVNVNNTKYLGKLTWITTAGCQWSNSSTLWSSFAAVAACPSPIVSGSVIAPATKIPAITIPNFEKGTYQFIASGAFATSTTGGRTGWRIANTAGTLTTSSGIMGSVGNGNATYNNIVTGIISNGAKQSNVTIEMQSYVIGANASIDVSGGSFLFSIEVYFTPDETETAVTNEQSSWFIDANMGGANTSLPTSAVTSYSEIQSTIYDLVLNTQKGSASAEIACASGFPSTGLTCTGGTTTESAGIAFIPPSAGKVYACADFSVSLLESQSLVWQIAETPNNAVTILQEGGERKDAAGASGTTIPNKVCGIFNFNDVSKKTLRLMYEKTATTGQHILIADRSGSAGQRDIHWTVIPITSAFNRPVLTGDQVTTPGVLKPVMASGFLTVSPAMTTEIGDFVGTCTSGGTDVTNCDFTPGFFLGTPNCSATPTNISGSTEQSARLGVSSSGFTVRMTSSGNANKFATYILCHGLKP